jgi:hypothetical protein
VLSSELPPTFVFELDWASPAERAEILAQMPQLNRQTMNFRLMQHARMLRVRACEDENRLVGWAGLDTEFTRDVGEVFSLYVIPEYRTYLVGMILETARATYLKQARATRVLVRMESATNTSLLRYRVRAGLVVEASRSEIPAATIALCRECELYAKQCTSQSYFWVDLDAFLARGIERLGQAIDVDALPQNIVLDPDRFRRTSRDLHPDGPIVGLTRPDD